MGQRHDVVIETLFRRLETIILMDSEAVCCETMDDDSEGWEEWEEKEDLEKQHCLFCECLFDTAEAVFKHCGSEHDFNLEGFVRENGIGFYDYIKMINYIRKRAPRPEELKCEVASRPWDSEEFLFPAQVNDGLLQYDVESLLEHLEACGTDGKMETAEEKVTRAEEKLSSAMSDLERLRIVVHDLLNTPEPSVDVASLRPSEDEAYFDSYAQLSIHEVMLKDRVRTQSYQDFIYKNEHLFKDKVVLDVGCGSGILSLFAAQAGARHVFAVEQADVVHWTRETVRENGFEDKITIIHGRIEDVDLPMDKVDLIVSEWMGYFLLFESMLDSVFTARDCWLKPGGAVYPDSCALWLVGIGNPAGHEAEIDFWNDVYGFRMSSLRRAAAIEGRVEMVNPTHILSQPVLVKRIDCCTDTVRDLDFVTNFSLHITRSAQLTDLCAYFEVYFEANCEHTVLLSTAPDKPPTHWKQTIFIWEQPFDVTAGEEICGSLACCKQAQDPRALAVTITLGSKQQTFLLQ
uniref:type I protein arginine methyltransferase n=3 Tax=Eptatretus burgeri TaxID=7764 RepID=A0A8C4QI70_EPTBU